MKPERNNETHRPSAPLVRGLDAVSPPRPVNVLTPETDSTPPETGGAGRFANFRPIRAGAEVVLRPLEPEDRKSFVELVAASLPELSRWLPAFAQGQTPGQHFRAELERTLHAENARTAWRRLALVDGCPVGMVSLINITRGLTFSADAAWWIGTPHTGKGLARRCLRMMLAHAFAPMPDGLGLHRVCATIDPANAASIRLAQRFGFRRNPAEDHHLLMGDRWRKHQCFVAEIHTLALAEIKPTAERSRDTLSG